MEVGGEEKENSFPVLSGACWLFFHPLSGWGRESVKPGCEKWSSERGGIGCKKNRVAKERKLKGSPFFSIPATNEKSPQIGNEEREQGASSSFLA